ncbi:MAG: YceI family protein [Xanthomonadaceae bacterium]|nr:YceI family protein [Xanthomonadaceae bacterium]
MALASSVFLFAGLAAGPIGGLAQEHDRVCFKGDQDSGELRFSGAVEGSGFTGRFGSFEVHYCMPGGQPDNGDIRVTVDLSSADSDNRDRDQTLLDEEFFAVGQYPVAVWTSCRIEPAGDPQGSQQDGAEFIAQGRLELKGVAALQAVRFTLRVDGEDLRVSGGFVMQGESEIDRQRFRIGTGEFADPEFIRNRVDVAFEIELSGPNAAMRRETTLKSTAYH